MSAFFSGAAYLVSETEAPRLVCATITADTRQEAEHGFSDRLREAFPAHQPQQIVLSQIPQDTERSIAAKVCANINPLQIPEAVRDYLMTEDAAE